MKTVAGAAGEPGNAPCRSRAGVGPERCDFHEFVLIFMMSLPVQRAAGKEKYRPPFFSPWFSRKPAGDPNRSCRCA